MTIASPTTQTPGSNTNGATTEFSFSFSVESYGGASVADQLEVIRETLSTGAEEVLTTGFSVSANGDQSTSPGGTVTFDTAPASGYRIWIRLNPSFTQQTDYQNQGGFLMETVEDQADHQQRQLNWLRDQVRKAPRVGVQAGASFNGEITGDVTPNYIPAVNPSGTGFRLVANNGSSNIVTATGSTEGRSLADRFGESLEVDARDFGVVADGTTDDSAAINAGMAALSARGGGTLVLPPGTIGISSSIDNQYAHVTVRGHGRSQLHTDGAAPSGGTIIKCLAAITALKHRTPANGASQNRLDGGGFLDLSVLSNGLMTRALHVTARRYGDYRLYIHNCEGTESVLFDALVSGVDLAESGDCQHFALDINLYLFDTAAAKACKGVVFSGVSSGGNTSVNRHGIHIYGRHYDGDLVEFYRADAMFIDTLRSTTGSGTGRSFLMRGTHAASGKLTSGIVVGLMSSSSSVTASYCEGTGDTDVDTAAQVVIMQLDKGNSTPRPTGGTGARVTVMNDQGDGVGFGFERLTLGQSAASLAAARTALGANDSLYINNGSESHARFSDGTNVWKIAMISGDFGFSRIAGSGAQRLSSIAVGLKVGSDAITAGANDSGGTGYRLLRIPNS